MDAYLSGTRYVPEPMLATGQEVLPSGSLYSNGEAGSKEIDV